MTEIADDRAGGLIIRFLDGTITPEEKTILFEWLSRSVENQKMLFEYRNIWDATSPAFDPQSVDATTAYHKALNGRAVRNRKRRNTALIRGFQKVAAVLLLPALAALIYLVSSRPAEPYGMEETITVISPFGVRSALTLPDGSTVWLNSGSWVCYPAKFRPGGREISLSGEAFFEVEADPKNPFSVSVSGMTVMATGTAFNIEAFPGDSIVAVTLAEGRLNVNWLDNKLNMSPNQRIVFNNATNDHKLYIGDIYKWRSWKDGVMIFRNDPLEYVFRRLGQTYNIDFAVDRDLRDYTYHATFESESLDEILDMLRGTAHIDYRKYPAGKFRDGTCRQRIEVYSTRR